MHYYYQQQRDLLGAVKLAVTELEGAYGLAVIHADQPDKLVCARKGSPLVIGIGIGENFIASDQLALRQVTDRFVYLEEGDIAEVSAGHYRIWDAQQQPVVREVSQIDTAAESADRGHYRHYMLKEIYEQPMVIQRSLAARLGSKKILVETLGARANELLSTVSSVQIVACGTSYHAGMVAKYWIEGVAGVPCRVEVASEFRYRKFKVQENTLFVTISQSGKPPIPGCIATGKDPGLLRQPGDLQCGAQLSGARIRYVPDDRGRAGNWRGVDQGVYHPVGGPAVANRRAGPSSRPQ